MRKFEPQIRLNVKEVETQNCSPIYVLKIFWRRQWLSAYLPWLNVKFCNQCALSQGFIWQLNAEQLGWSTYLGQYFPTKVNHLDSSLDYHELWHSFDLKCTCDLFKPTASFLKVCFEYLGHSISHSYTASYPNILSLK